MSDSCNPIDSSLPGSSVHGILKERILEWIAISFSGRSSWARSLTWVSCIAGKFFTGWARREDLPTIYWFQFSSVQFSSVSQSCLTLCDPMHCSTLGFPVHHQLPELVQTHVHWVSDGIQPSHPLSCPSPPAFNLSQHQGLFQRVSSSHQVAKVLEF